jgi:hypothetical protein
VPPRRVPHRGGEGKIEALRAKTKAGDLDALARTFLAATGIDHDDIEDDFAPAYVGAVHLAELAWDVRAIRQLLTPPKS